MVNLAAPLCRARLCLRPRPGGAWTAQRLGPRVRPEVCACVACVFFGGAELGDGWLQSAVHASESRGSEEQSKTSCGDPQDRRTVTARVSTLHYGVAPPAGAHRDVPVWDIHGTRGTQNFCSESPLPPDPAATASSVGGWPTGGVQGGPERTGGLLGVRPGYEQVKLAVHQLRLPGP